MSVFLDNQSGGGGGSYVTGAVVSGGTLDLGFIPKFFIGIVMSRSVSSSSNCTWGYFCSNGAAAMWHANSGSLKMEPFEWVGTSVTLPNWQSNNPGTVYYIAFK